MAKLSWNKKQLLADKAGWGWKGLEVWKGKKPPRTWDFPSAEWSFDRNEGEKNTHCTHTHTHTRIYMNKKAMSFGNDILRVKCIKPWGERTHISIHALMCQYSSIHDYIQKNMSTYTYTPIFLAVFCKTLRCYLHFPFLTKIVAIRFQNKFKQFPF